MKNKTNRRMPLHSNNVFRRVDACPKSELCAIFPNTKKIIIIFPGLLKMMTHFICFIFYLNVLCTFYCLFWKAWSPFPTPPPPFLAWLVFILVLILFQVLLHHLFSPETILLELSAFLLQTGQLLAWFPAALFIPCFIFYWDMINI